MFQRCCHCTNTNTSTSTNTNRADDRDRTGDLTLTKGVLYRLSYVSSLTSPAPALAPALAPAPAGTQKPPLSSASRRSPSAPTHQPSPSTSNQSGRRGSNPRHQAWKACALPAELLPRVLRTASIASCRHCDCSVVVEGFEPSKSYAGRFTVCSRWPLGYPT